MASVSSIGIGSGVLTSDLIEQLASAEREPTEKRLDLKEDEVTAKLSDLSRLKSAITDLRLSARTLSTPESMSSNTATSSGSSIGVTANTSAKTGSYALTVSNLAVAQSLSSGTFADKDTTTVGTGTLSFTVGGVTENLTVDSSNNTLQGLSDAINDMGLDVNSSVIYNGSSYQLVLSASKTGLANAISISATDNDGNSTDASGISQFIYNATNQNLTQDVAAEDAAFTLNGVAITRSLNTVDDVVDGLTLTLNAETASAVNVTVSKDLNAVTERVQDLVDKYNALQEIINEVTAFDSDTGEKGTLLGSSTVRTISTQLRSTLSSIVPGLESSNVRSLSELGITTNSESGQLEFNSLTFQSKLQSYPNDVAALFADQGRTTDAQVKYVSAGINTKIGSYAVDITQVATQGAFTGNVALGGSTVIDADNDTFKIKVNGVESNTITLTAATYTDSELLAEIQTQLDADANIAGSGVTVSLDGSNQLVFTSGQYGSSSTVEITAIDTNTAAQLGLTVATGVDGLDVAGTINGKAATGNGQYLTSSEGDSKGLKLQITGGATGARGEATYIEGVGDQMVDLVNSYLSSEGLITVAINGFNSQLEKISEDRTELDDRITALTDRLARQFTAADLIISQLKNTENFLSTQLEALLASSTGSKS
ncbi:Flagellar capping protein [Hahella chejuensis KCTC 2396]|uniref:Flagellar hook-associated protein 2 n=1 Tax=Hahella chejuensis (strain KCTC 2396) TaxID=349521 RepID=Q2SCW2_HAHCH|nr:flagellar filament capping protein FliD [Hahella chejuensis]ABC31512.1 Flagellar capping protein [Hahella chejuensis KCTC 2396]